jgi:hypothetical protein
MEQVLGPENDPLVAKGRHGQKYIIVVRVPLRKAYDFGN